MRGLAITVVLLVSGAAIADDPKGEKDEFYRGTNLVADGKYAEAAELFRALADRSPQDPFADDALLELGRLYEEHLRDPLRAAQAYERLEKDYPQSRLAVRAHARVESLRAEMGADGRAAQALAELDDAIYQYPRRPHAESIARVEKLLKDWPDFPGAPHAAYWLATVLEQEGRTDDALARFREVAARWPASEWSRRARQGEGDLLLDQGQLDAAEKAYRSMSDTPDMGVDEALGRVTTARLRRRVYVASWIALVLGLLAAFAAAATVAGGVGRAARALLRPPVEFWYLLPVAALFVGAGLTERGVLGHALEFIMAGGLLVAWLSGAALEAARAAGRMSVRRVVAHALVTTVAVAAVCYIAMTRERLIDQMAETIQYGPE